MTRTRTYAACLDSAARGLYADALPPAEPTLRQLAERAIHARKEFHDFDGSDRSLLDRDKWAELNETDWEATRAFNTALRDATGIPFTMWMQLAEGILP